MPLRSFLVATLLATVLSAQAEDLDKQVRDGIQRHLVNTFLFANIDGQAGAFSGKVQGIRGDSCVFGEIYQYQAYAARYLTSEVTAADRANGVLWKGDVQFHATPYRKIHYNNRHCGSSAFDPEWKKPCWSEWRDIPERMRFVWQLVLTKKGWEPYPHRADHADWRLAGGAPISRERPLSIEEAKNLLSYATCN